MTKTAANVLLSDSPVLATPIIASTPYPPPPRAVFIPVENESVAIEKNIVSKNASICTRERITNGKKTENTTALKAQSHLFQDSRCGSALAVVKVIQAAKNIVKYITGVNFAADCRLLCIRNDTRATIAAIIAIGTVLISEYARTCGFTISIHTYANTATKGNENPSRNKYDRITAKKAPRIFS